MSSGNINVIYIASIGRSGTTLMDCILGAHSQMASIGEVHLWPHEIREDGVLPCGSGKFVQEDPFWKEMKRRVNPLSQPAPRIDYFREEHDGGQTLRVGRLRDFYGTSLSPSTRSKVLRYAENTEKIYDNFLDLVEEKEGTRPLWVVDSSKDPYRLAWLYRSKIFNLKVVHLVRKPKGFIHSVTKPFIYTDDNPIFKRLFWTIRQSGAWSIRNQLILNITQNHLPPEDHVLINYEDLASEPIETTKRVMRTADTDFEEEAVANFREGSPYAIGGNPMRQRDGDIELDEKWKENLPDSSKLITDLITSLNRDNFV